MQRTTNQNRLYHAYIKELFNSGEVIVYDGRFQALGYPNPLRIRPAMFGLMGFRNLMKQVDVQFPKNENGLALSSTKLSIEQMISHVNFLEVLLSEMKG